MYKITVSKIMVFFVLVMFDSFETPGDHVVGRPD